MIDFKHSVHAFEDSKVPQSMVSVLHYIIMNSLRENQTFGNARLPSVFQINRFKMYMKLFCYLFFFYSTCSKKVFIFYCDSVILLYLLVLPRKKKYARWFHRPLKKGWFYNLFHGSLIKTLKLTKKVMWS